MSSVSISRMVRRMAIAWTAAGLVDLAYDETCLFSPSFTFQFIHSQVNLEFY